MWVIGGLGVNLLLCLWGKRGGGGVLCRDGFWTERFGRVEMGRRLQGGWKTGEGVSMCGKGDEFLERRGVGMEQHRRRLLGWAWLGDWC